MIRKRVYWITAAIIIIVILSGYALKIIFWPEYRFTGRVVDIETKRPIAGAIAYIPESGRYAITDKNGKFELASDQPGRFLINIKARGFESKLCEDKINRLLTTTDIGTVYLENDIRVNWPIPDSIKNRNFNIQIYDVSRPDYNLTRSVRLSFKFKEPPADMDYIARSHSLKDSLGGEWYLFFIWDSPYMITYINPDGSFERYIPTPLKHYGYRSMELNGKFLYVRGVLGETREYQESYLDSFAVADFHADIDNDSLLDRFELFCHTDPKNSDSDNDGLSDFDDPMPTIPSRTQYNDTTALLESVLDDIKFNPLCLEFNAIGHIAESLKDKDRKQLVSIAARHVSFLPEFTSRLGSFEELLLKLNLAELRNVVSILQNNYSDCELYNRFHCYRQLAQVNEISIEKVKAAISTEICRIPIIPVNVQGDIVDFAAHPKHSWDTIIPINSFEFRRKVLERYFIRENIELVKMNSLEAVVHYSTAYFGYEIVYRKDNGEWKKAYQVQLYIS